MNKRKFSISALKIAILGVFLSIAVLVGSCSATSQIPESAVDALNKQWNSLPGSLTHDLLIVRAWRGEVPAEAPTTPTMEVWCVETVMSARLEDSAGPETILWLVTRTDREELWLSAPLMTMSSLWPYQACGVEP